jgi:gamma-glutamyltranspeptidase/glutathione hydrolase
MRFTTRPEIKGTFGVCASTHWIATAVGMGVLEKGGNAIDASVAMGFVLQILEPHLCGPAGDMPALVYSAAADRIDVICGQGPAPAGATIAHYRAQGLDLVPGSGLLATVIPGAFDAWMLMLRDYGTISVRAALEPAIHYARHGHPMLPRVADAIAGLTEFFAAEWPTSAEVWTPGGAAPAANSLFRNPQLADCYERIVREAEGATGREAQVEAARRAWSQGFVAEAVGAYLATAEVLDVSGQRNRGVLTAEDMAGWSATVERPLSHDYGDWTIHKTGPWGQGPVLAQALSLLKGFDIAAMDPEGPDFIHTVVEAMKLAYADREAYYGDPAHSAVPMDALLSDAYAEARRALIGEEASLEQRPGRIPGFERQADAYVARAARTFEARTGASAGEPTMAHLTARSGVDARRSPVAEAPRSAGADATDRRGDTVHIDVIDRWGNMVSTTPSGGWLQSNPCIPGLGFPLNSRAQMFWLDEGLPTSLAPGRRPRTTLTPSMASLNGRPTLAFGTPGGDQQDQWQLILFLRHVHHGLNLQEAIDAPLFHTGHFQGSFYPREARPGHLMIERSAGTAVLDELRRRGHRIEEAEPWTVGRLTATRRDADGLLHAAATPRLMQAYAAGR